MSERVDYYLAAVSLMDFPQGVAIPYPGRKKSVTLARLEEIIDRWLGKDMGRNYLAKAIMKELKK